MGKEVITTRGWCMTMMNGIGWWQGTEIGKQVEQENMERRDYWEKEYPDPDRDWRDIPYLHSLQYGHG